MKCSTYFYHLLARKDYSSQELYQKGLQKGFPRDEVIETLRQLQEWGDQSDYRLVENTITANLKKYGKSVIKKKCLAKGIDPELFEQIWEQTVSLEAETEDNLSEIKAKVARKYKIESWQHLDPKTKAKMINFLSYRGFDGFQLLRQWQEEERELM